MIKFFFLIVIRDNLITIKGNNKYILHLLPFFLNNYNYENNDLQFY